MTGAAPEVSESFDDPDDSTDSTESGLPDAPRGSGRPRMVLVAAVADNGVIAHQGGLPWRIPADMRHFRALTSGHAVLTGRTTHAEMGVLPDRTNIVLTRDPSFAADGVLVAHDLDEALALAAGSGPDGVGPLMVIGGAQVYALALEAGAREQVLTEVHLSPEGDTYYPDFDRSAWLETRRESHLEDETPYEFVWLAKVTERASDD